MNQDLKAFSDFLVENYDDAELTRALKLNFNEDTKKVVSYVKENLLSESALDNLMNDLLVRDTSVLIDKKDALSKKIEDGSFVADDALDFASELFAKQTNIKVSKKLKEKLLHNIRVIDRAKDPRRTRMAKMFAFQMISALNKKLDKMSKEKDGQTRTIVTKEGKSIVQSMKGKNVSSAVRHEVQRVVKQEGNTITRELERIDEMMTDPAKAKTYCSILSQAFIQERYEGQKKNEQFTNEYKEYKAKETQIEKMNAEKTEFEIGEKGRIEWNNLNLLLLAYEIQQYGKGVSKLTLPQIKAVVRKFKKANFEALELVDKALEDDE